MKEVAPAPPKCAKRGLTGSFCVQLLPASCSPSPAGLPQGPHERAEF